MPAPSELQFNPDMSSQWKEHLLRHNLGPESILEGYPSYTLVGEFPVANLRGHHFKVTHSPRDSKPIDCAHTSVNWPPDSIGENRKEPPKGIRNALRRDLTSDFKWVLGTDAPPPDGA
jgi:hypothetical protein